MLTSYRLAKVEGEESPAGPAAATASSNSDAGNPVAVQERHTESGPAELDSPKWRCRDKDECWNNMTFLG